jgi:hypothetical protein
MTGYSREIINKYVAVGLNKQRTTKDRGDALEDLLCYYLKHCRVSTYAETRGIRFIVWRST